ncbi:hypothetical protein [Moorena producens]|uniref:hypothetical protein n=1 Tax=Moorena producens TaxID=1155739 RepID=UPI0009F27F73|nr:hypothetical protein [Moorena producens]
MSAVRVRLPPLTIGIYRFTARVQQAQLLEAIEAPMDDSGLWNSSKVADWMSRLLGGWVAPQRGWEDLKQMEFRLRLPRRDHQPA